MCQDISSFKGVDLRSLLWYTVIIIEHSLLSKQSLPNNAGQDGGKRGWALADTDYTIDRRHVKLTRTEGDLLYF